MRGALIHRARLVVREQGPRNAQGERQTLPAEGGPWFKARLMERGGVNAKRRRGQNTTDAKVTADYELLADYVDENGDPVVLTASNVVETDCDLLGSPVLELSGKPEHLNNGRREIGWMAFANRAKDAA